MKPSSEVPNPTGTEQIHGWDEQLRDALLGAPVLFFETDVDGTIRYGADQLAEVLGRDPSELYEQQLLEIVEKAQRKVFTDMWAGVLKGDQARGREFRFIGAEGRLQAFWVSFFPVRGLVEEVVSVRGVACDLGEQQSLAYALEAAEERFSVIFQESSDPILILSMEGDILSANPSFEHSIGIRSEELFCNEKQWKDFVHDNDWENLRQQIQPEKGEPSGDSIEVRLKSSPTGWAWYEQRLSVLHDEDGQSKGMMAVFRNIDRRKQQEKKLLEKAQAIQHRHQRAQALISRLTEFFTRVSDLPSPLHGYLEGVCDILFEMYRPFMVYINVLEGDRMFYHAGRQAPSSVVQPSGWPVQSSMCKHMTESGTPLYNNALNESDEYKQDEFTTSLNLKTYLGAPLRDSTGKIRGTIALVDTQARSFDSLDVELITVASLQVAARLRAEEQEEVKRELENHLRQAQKMEAVGLLAGGIAHDFNNILSGILGFSSFMMSKEEPGTELYKNLGLIEQSAIRAADLTRQLLAFARRKHFAKEPVTLNEVIGDALGILRHSLAKNIELIEKMDKDLPPVMGDRGQLNQVIMNLCINAADAMSDSGGELVISSEVRPLNFRERNTLVHVEEKGDYVCITIRDTGIGMSDHVREHVFDPFYTTKSNSGGTGLGLSIVYGIVTNHGGDITVESKEGEGTSFTVYIPAYRGAIPLKASDTAPGTLKGTETVLVVDDEPIVRQMVTEVLKSSGYNVVCAGSGEEALQIFNDISETVDLVLLDMIMPGMDGEETFHAMKELDDEVTVLLTSGYINQERSDRIIAEGAKGMVHKPYKSHILLKEIREVLQNNAVQSS